MKRKTKSRDDFYSFYSRVSEKNFPRPKRSRVPFIAFLFFVAILSVSAWVGTSFFSKQSVQTADPVELTISAPATTTSGFVTEYVVQYKNTSTMTLPSAGLFLQYPEQYTITQTTPEATNEKKNFWNLGALPPGANGDIHIKGIYQHTAEGRQKLLASLQYEHPLYRSSFVVKGEREIDLDASAQKRIRIEGPTTLRVGEQFTYTIHYSDFTDFGNLDALALQVQMPAGFNIQERKPAATDVNSWTAGSLQSSLDPITHEGTLTLKGVVEKSDLGQHHILSAVVQKNPNGNTVTLLEQDVEVQVLGGDLVLKIMADNQLAGRPIQFGIKVPIVLSFENKGTSTYHNVTLTLTKKGSLGLFSQADVPGATKDGNTIVWNASAVKALDTVAPLAKGDISFELPIDSWTALDQMQFAPSDLSVSLTVSARSEKQEDLDGKKVDQPTDISGPTLTLPLLSDAHFEAFVKQVPVSDTPGTALRVYWSLENSLHELSDVRMEGSLPKGVEWVGEHARTAGDISYSPTTRVVAWTLNKLPQSVHRIDGSFDVRVAEMPKNKVLLQDIRLSAKDAVLSFPLTQTILLLTAP